MCGIWKVSTQGGTHQTSIAGTGIDFKVAVSDDLASDKDELHIDLVDISAI